MSHVPSCLALCSIVNLNQDSCGKQTNELKTWQNGVCGSETNWDHRVYYTPLPPTGINLERVPKYEQKCETFSFSRMKSSPISQIVCMRMGTICTTIWQELSHLTKSDMPYPQSGPPGVGSCIQLRQKLSAPEHRDLLFRRPVKAYDSSQPAI